MGAYGRQRQSEPQLISLLNTASLAAARGPLSDLAGLSCSSAATSEASSGGRASQGFDLRHQSPLCGLPNLGNTCFLNAVTQCLLHCRPFRNDLESQQPGASHLGDRLISLWGVYSHKNAITAEIGHPLAAWVHQVYSHAGFVLGTQQDAAECLMHLLLNIAGGDMQRRVCGANAAGSVESMILCEIADEAQVHDMLLKCSCTFSDPSLVHGSTRGYSLREAPRARPAQLEFDDRFQIDLQDKSMA